MGNEDIEGPVLVKPGGIPLKWDRIQHHNDILHDI